jgi:molybdate transport system substrate-binding protein
VQETFERLGIVEQIKDKTKALTAPGAIPQAVAKGEVELGVFLTNVLIAPGVELAGPFPGDLLRSTNPTICAILSQMVP